MTLLPCLLVATLLAETPPAIAPPAEEPLFRLTTGGGLDVGIGLAAGASLGGRAEVGLRFESWSASLEAHVDWAAPAHLRPATRSISGAVYFGLVALCLHLSDVSLCAVGGGGVMRSSVSGIPQPFLVTTPVAIAGARLGYDIPLTERLRLRAALDAYGRLVQVQVKVEDVPAWTSGILAGTFGLSVLAAF